MILSLIVSNFVLKYPSSHISNLGGDILGQASGRKLTTWGKYVTKDDQRGRKLSPDWIWSTKGGWGDEEVESNT